MQHEETFIKNSLVIGDTLKAKVSVKVRSKKDAITKEYELPFSV